MKEYNISTDEEKRLITILNTRKDAEAERIKRYLHMPDLSRTVDSPIKDLVLKITNISDFKDFTKIKVPEIVPTEIAFDLFDFAPNHPARSKSDTYFIDEKNILRPHTTVMWYYYLNLEEVKEKIAKGEPIGVFSHGKVYRKDEIDRTHMNVFHQIDGLYICPKKQREIVLKDLQNIEAKIVKSVFGEEIEYRFHEETFPYTHPSTEIEIKRGNDWLEILGSGVVKGSVLQKLGVDPNIYNGWAFGFGLERWAIISMELPDIRLLWSEDERVKKQLELDRKFVAVSKYPSVVRDISFVMSDTFAPNDYFDLVRDTLGDLAEEVALLDKYENKEKFGENKVSYAYRITYRSLNRTLTNTEVDLLHKKLEEKTSKIFAAKIR